MRTPIPSPADSTGSDTWVISLSGYLVIQRRFYRYTLVQVFCPKIYHRSSFLSSISNSGWRRGLLPLLTYINSCWARIAWRFVRFSVVSCKNAFTGYALELLTWVNKKKTGLPVCAGWTLTRQPTQESLKEQDNPRIDSYYIYAQYISKYTVSVHANNYVDLYTLHLHAFFSHNYCVSKSFSRNIPGIQFNHNSTKMLPEPPSPFHCLRCSRFPCTSVCACARLGAPAGAFSSCQTSLRGSDHLGKVFRISQLKSWQQGHSFWVNSPYSTTI